MKKAYIGYTTNKTMRKTSTSGGICQILSNWIVERGGIVSGVYFDENFQLVRGFAEKKEELIKFSKSKYLQADQGETYKIIRKMLTVGREVLFIGTPCQVSGLISFLGKRPENLYSIDFVCLGVPSQKCWDLYVLSISKGSKLKSVDFKDKQNGWKDFTFHAELLNGMQINEPGRKNIYMHATINKINNRPSCYHCQYRNLERQSDLTVADAWGTQEIVPDLHDNKGTSSIMVNTNNGRRMLEAVSQNLILREVSVAQLWQNNTAAWRDYKRPIGRKRFYHNLNRKGFVYAYTKNMFWERIRGKFLFWR